jgi:hypothetical protein
MSSPSTQKSSKPWRGVLYRTTGGGMPSSMRCAARLNEERRGRAEDGLSAVVAVRRYLTGVKKPVTVPESVKVPPGVVTVLSAPGNSHVTKAPSGLEPLYEALQASA